MPSSRATGRSDSPSAPSATTTRRATRTMSAAVATRACSRRVGVAVAKSSCSPLDMVNTVREVNDVHNNERRTQRRTEGDTDMKQINVVTPGEWRAARCELLAQEKEFTRARDALSAARRALPAVRLDKHYTFDGPTGQVSLLDLFEDARQLIVYHFMFEPGWDEGCPSCSYFADNFTGALVHLAARD